MFKNIEYASASRKDQNIDVIHVRPNIAWILDGANSLFPFHISDDESDAKWFVKQINDYLREHVSNFSDADELFHNAQKAVIERYEAMSDEEITDMEYPNTALALVYVQKNQLCYHVLGPCEILFHFDDGSTKSVMDLRLPHMDARLTSICRDLREKKHVPLYQVRTFMDHMMIENRLHRNLPGGYYILGEDPSVWSETITGVVPLNHLHSVSLICHGFEEYYHPPRMEAALKEYIFVKRNQKLVNDYEQSLRNQVGNFNLARYVQEQLSRSSTFVTFEIAKEMLETKEVQ